MSMALRVFLSIHNVTYMYSGKTYKKIFISSFFILALFMNMASFTPKAHAWWTISDIFGDIMTNVLENIQDQIKGALLASLKVAAVSALQSQVGQLIGGTSVGNALMITDWYDFMYTRPAEQVTLYMNDFFTMSTRGKYASANYIGSKDTPDTVAGNYPAYLVAVAKQSIPPTGEVDIPQFDLDQYSANPQTLFREGDFRGLNALVSNPMNNPFGFSLSAVSYSATKMNQAIEIAKTEAQSSGLIGKKENGKTIAPAATIENMLNDAQNIGNNIIAAAENPNIVSSIVTAMVNKAVNAMIQKGVGKIQANIQKEIARVDSQAIKALDKVNKELGPGAKFLKETSQKTDVVKAYTSPPPSANCTVDQGC